MASNRLFIYDPETNTAAMIARGYSNGWHSAGTHNNVNKFFESAAEHTGKIIETRYQLRTEQDLPENTKIYWDEP